MAYRLIDSWFFMFPFIFYYKSFATFDSQFFIFAPSIKIKKSKSKYREVFQKLFSLYQLMHNCGLPACMHGPLYKHREILVYCLTWIDISFDCFCTDNLHRNLGIFKIKVVLGFCYRSSPRYTTIVCRTCI